MRSPDRSRSAHRCNGSRHGFTLIELLIATVILAILAMIVARPLGKARERAMTAAAQMQVRNLVSVIDQYEIVTGRLPRALSELTSSGYEDSGEIEVCWFEYSPGGEAGPYVLIEARHRRGMSVVQTRHPIYGGRLDVIDRAAATGPCR